MGKEHIQHPDQANRAGQVAVYLMMSLVAVFLLALVAVDAFVSVRAKNRLQNGGDAAALAAAHRQGELINEIGRLNIEHIVAALGNDTNKCLAIGLEQRRLALLEPVYAMRLASEAAERNGLEKNDDFSAILRMHLDEVRTVYAVGGGDDGEIFRESYPGAWHEYAAAIANVASEGLAAGADSIEFYRALGSHPLLDPAFYDAIAGKDWCWFWFKDKGLLDNYRSHADWGTPEPHLGNSTENSEFFSLHLVATTNALASRFSFDEIIGIANRCGGKRLRREDYVLEDGSIDCGLLDDPGYTWFFFDDRFWGRWFDGRRLVDDDDGYEYPVVGTIKDEYNVRGCAAVCRTRIDGTESLTTGATHANVWNAAAKPFGTVETAGDAAAPVTALGNFVTPCMTDARLVSVDSAARQNLDCADLAWFAHMRFHLRDYILNGPKGNGGCWFCAQLKKWEDPEFRYRGANWLKHHSGECIRPVDGGRSGRGGTSHGH